MSMVKNLGIKNRVSEDVIKQAIYLMKSGATLTAAAKTVGISITCLRYRSIPSERKRINTGNKKYRVRNRAKYLARMRKYNAKRRALKAKQKST